MKGQPKFADVGLVAEIARSLEESSWVGTEDYMPPLPEPPGTPLNGTDQGEFMRLNKVILKACLPHLGQRYASAAEMRAALLKVRNGVDPDPTEEITQRPTQPSPPMA